MKGKEKLLLWYIVVFVKGIGNQNGSNLVFKLLMCFFALQVLSACRTHENKTHNSFQNHPIVIDVLNSCKDVRDFPLSRLAGDVDLISFESTKESYFSMFTSLDVSDHYFLITSEKEEVVLLFNRDGKFVRKIGNRGRGPGEYLNPHFAAMPGIWQYLRVSKRSCQVTAP